MKIESVGMDVAPSPYRFRDKQTRLIYYTNANFRKGSQRPLGKFMDREVTEITIERETTHDDSPNCEVKLENERPPSASMLSCWTVLGKTMIGVGLLGLAAATAVCGWFLGIVLLVVAGSAAMFTLHLINCLIIRSERRHVSFYTIAEMVAPVCRWVVDIAIAVKSLGVGTAYFQVYGTQMASFVTRVAPSVSSTISQFTLRAVIILAGLIST